ncbi:MAG: deiodinase family protein [Gemmataceae bacterium]|nr:deiodinase family protein [Gemmataceae bacterium]
MSHRLPAVLLLSLAAGFAAAGERAPMPRWVNPDRPKLPPGFDPDRMSNPKAAEAAAAWIEDQYPDRQPEAVKMLVAILRGSQLMPGEGWFGPSQSRYTWGWLTARAGLEPTARAIRQDQFPGTPGQFDALDRDGDGAITQFDLDWSDRNMIVMQGNFLTRVFRRMNTGNDGRLTKAEMEAYFDQLAGEKGFVSADDFRRFNLPRGGGGGFSPGDAPTPPVLIRGLFAGEIGSMSEGPKVGQKAPDFTLRSPDGLETHTLSKLTGKKPVVLVTGNFTCGPFRGLYPDVEAVYRRHKDKANFLLVYVREAHPSDGWGMESNTKAGVKLKQPLTLGERVQACDQFCRKLKPAMPVAVDDIADPVGTAYSGMPARLYVIDEKGVVVYKSGRGPFGFKPGEMEQALVMAEWEASGE